MLSAERLVICPVDQERGQELILALRVAPVTAQLLIQRGMADPEAARSFLDDGAETAHDPYAMPQMADAVRLLQQAIAEGGRILIHGDYDVDGVCATVLLHQVLTDLGAQVDYHVPDRFTEGYGVSLAAVEQAAARGTRLILTADCGSSSRDAVERAHALGMQVIVTDHHHIPRQPPQPEVFMNPHLTGCGYPFPDLCGTGVAYKVACALHQAGGLEVPYHLLDLVAMATIADVVPLLGENRALVRSGLQRLAATERPGLRALAGAAGLPEGRASAFDVAFGLGPRINAAGRLEHARLAVQLLLCQDPEECRTRARQLDQLNQQRRAVEKAMRMDIEARLADCPDKLALGVVVEAGEDWHQGVVGIAASRVVDRYGVPALIMERRGELSKGSGRSPENIDLYAAMSRCSDLFVKFGGHSRAAGFTVRTQDIDTLRARLAQAVEEVRVGPAPIRVDLALPLAQADLALARDLGRLEPLGEGNRQPLFLAERVRLDEIKAIGADRDHLRFTAAQGTCRRKAVAFRQGADLAALRPDRLYYDVLYHLQEESWDGDTYASLVIEALLEPPPALAAWVSQERAALPEPEPGGPHFVDLRHVLDRREYLRRLLEVAPSPLVVVGSPAQADRTAHMIHSELGHQVSVQVHGQLTASAQDVVLLTPPGDIEALRHPLLWAAYRVHCLFSERELDLEESRQWGPDRATMEGIWKAMVKCARGRRLDRQCLARAERQAGLPAGSPALSMALEIFEELGLVSWDDAGEGRTLVLESGGGRRLEESRRFRELGHRRQRFASVRRAFLQRELRLREQLRA